ncbi:MAG: GNAT family N-acetyltransferase [Planctomycetota bacterium]
MSHSEFETERLVLRPTTPDDAEFVFEILNTPKWLENIGDRNVHSLDDARNYIAERMTPQLQRLGYSNNTMIRKSDDAKVGFCGFYDREGVEGVDIGFALLPQYEGNGYAVEGASRLMQLAKTEFGITQVSAITIEANVASRRLIEKLGLEFVEMIELPDDDVPLMLYRKVLS